MDVGGFTSEAKKLSHRAASKGIASEGSSSESRCGVVELWSNLIRRLLKQVDSFGNKLPTRMMCGVWA